MRRLFYLVILAVLSNSLMGQQWSITLSDSLPGAKWICDMTSADGGEFVVGAGYQNYETWDDKDGFVFKADKDGNLVSRTIHLPGQTLEYFSVLQIPNGNYMAFGICDDSLCDYHFQRYLHVDVFDGQLGIVSSRTYCVDDETFDCFYYPHEGHSMKSAVTNSGTVLLATRLAYRIESWGYNLYLRLYEFDETGDTLRTHDPGAGIGSIKRVTRIPDSDNLMIVLDGGSFGYNTGIVGVYEIDKALNVVHRQQLVNLNGSQHISDLACDGTWIDGRYLIIDGEQYVHDRQQGRSSFKYHTLFEVDKEMNTRAALRLPPYDSTTSIPMCTNTAYANDSTIFALSYSHGGGVSEDCQTNVLLTDRHLNLLGRKVFRKADVLMYVCPPAAFNDGSCLFLLFSTNGSHFQGEPFSCQELVKIRREDIEITWDAVHEGQTASQAYPNPSKGLINIPVGETVSGDARIQMYDTRGVKCLDSAIGSPGNLVTLDIHNLDAGLYVYKIVSGNRETTSGKFIRE